MSRNNLIFDKGDLMYCNVVMYIFDTFKTQDKKLKK